MVFIKHFDPSKPALLGAGKVFVNKTSKVSDLIPIINERMRWTSGTALKLYEVNIIIYRVRVLGDLHHQGNQTGHD